MKKGYYIACTDSSGGMGKCVGVQKKINMQVKCLSEIFEIKWIKLREYPVSVWGRFCRRLPFFTIRRLYDEAFAEMETPDFVYIRRDILDRGYMGFLKQLRRKYPGCKIIMEVPTYPYKKEYYRVNMLPYLMKDIYYRKEYKKHIDRFVTYSNDKEIFGVKTIQTMNGIDVKSVRPVCGDKSDESINLLFVGFMEKQMGLERIINGMSRHANKMNVKLHFVGSGSKLKMYHDLADKLGLSSYIKFYGNLYGNELDEVYDKADLGISPCAMYKIGLNCLSALKTREYLAKGLPFIGGCQIDVFENHPSDFYLEFANDSSPIDIGKVESFYNSLISKYQNKAALRDSVREYALKYVDNSVVLKPIIDYIASGE